MRIQRASQQKSRVAIHEAAHAVVATAVGMRVHRVELRRDWLHGQCLVEVEINTSPSLIAVMAGPVGEELYAAGSLGKPKAVGGLTPGEVKQLDDLYTGRISLEDFDRRRPESDTDRVAKATLDENKRAARRAMDLLIDHWPAVLTIAQELVDHGEVTGDRAAEIFHGLAPKSRLAFQYIPTFYGWDWLALAGDGPEILRRRAGLGHAPLAAGR